jgi:hypothetical protein
MQKMGAPLALVSAICHLATVAVVVNMRAELSTARDMPAGPHRNLLDSNAGDLVTVARMNKAVDHLQDTLGSRLTGVEHENIKLKALVKVLKDDQMNTKHGSRARSHDGSPHDDTVSLLSDISREAAKNTHRNVTTPADGRRRTQSGQACARIHDFQVLTAAAMDACCPSGGGHRRSLQASCSLPHVPIGGVRGGVPAVHVGLRRAADDHAGGASRPVSELCGVVRRAAGWRRADAAAGGGPDVPRAGRHGGSGAGGFNAARWPSAVTDWSDCSDQSSCATTTTTTRCW